MVDRFAIQPAELADLAAIRALLGEYQEWLGVDLSFQGFEHEVDDPLRSYGPPDGTLLIARIGGEPAGMIGLRRLDRDRAEMKRLFVRTALRGSGLGRQLIIRIVDEARALGYREIVLDTLPVMQHAQHLYEQLGFREIPPYYQSPLPGTRYLALRL